jgi:hypothetical protein
VTGAEAVLGSPEVNSAADDAAPCWVELLPGWSDGKSVPTPAGDAEPNGALVAFVVTFGTRVVVVDRAVVTGSAVVTFGSVVVTFGSDVVTGRVVVTFGSVVLTGRVVVSGSVAVTVGSVVLTGSVVVMGGSAVVIVSCGTADRPGIAVAATKPRKSRVARQAARLTG